MRPTPRVTEILTWCLLICLVGTQQSFPKEDPVLDLTIAPASMRRSLGVPGSFVSGTSNGSVLGPPEYDLPLKVRIEETQQGRDPSGNLLRLQVELLNAGTVLYQLPSCVDEVKAHGVNQTDRRTFEFRFEFSGGNLRAPATTTGAVSFTAASVPECSTPIPPGARIHVLVETTVPDNVRTLLKQSHRINLIASCGEFVLEDSRFQLSKRSREIRSGPVPLTLK
jgi:hypothetical protein